MERNKKYAPKEKRVRVDPTVATPSQAIARALRGEYVPGGARPPLPHGDYSNYPRDLATSLRIVRDANERFMALPALVRQHFGNSPAALSDAIVRAQSDEHVRQDLITLGLIKAPKSTPTPPKTEDINPSTPTDAPKGKKAD